MNIIETCKSCRRECLSILATNERMVQCVYCHKSHCKPCLYYHWPPPPSKVATTATRFYEIEDMTPHQMYGIHLMDIPFYKQATTLHTTGNTFNLCKQCYHLYKHVGEIVVVEQRPMQGDVIIVHSSDSSNDE